MDNLKICALVPNRTHVFNKKHKQRLNTNNYYGLTIIIDTINTKIKEKIRYVSIEDVNKYDIVLYSMLSIEDYYSFVYTYNRKLKEKKKGIWIIGGSGISNINPLIKYFDYIVLGRGESLIIELLKSIVQGKEINNTSIVEAKKYDPLNRYYINYTKVLWKGSENTKEEKMYGCKYNCSYCRYRTATLPPNLRKKDNKTTMPGNEETFWELKIKDGSFFTTSLDGLTEKIRYAVNKPISNKQIINKFILSSKTTKKINIKIYFIIGYPNINNITFKELLDCFKEIDNNINNCKIFIKLHFTPFGAEPQTPMQWEKVNINTDYRDIMNIEKKISKYLFEGKNLKAIILNTTIKPLALLKRMVYNRAGLEDYQILDYLGSHPEQNTHNNKSDKKLKLTLERFEVTKFTQEYAIGTILPNSNIKSWKDDVQIIKEARITRKKLSELKN